MQTTDLRLASYLPPEHFGTRLIIEPLIQRIREYTGGSVTVQNFPGGQLANAPGTLNAVTSGIAQMGFIGVGYVGDTGHPWTNGQVERINRTIKDATIKRVHYDNHDPSHQIRN